MNATETGSGACETGAARRSWLRGVVEVAKRYLMHAAGHNLGVVMRKLFGIGTPRSLQGRAAALCAALARLPDIITKHLIPADGLFASRRPRASISIAATPFATAA